jgi:hypothetical protein
MSESDWKSELGKFMDGQARTEQDAKTLADHDSAQVKNFIKSVVMPAFEAVQAELTKYGKNVEVHAGSDFAHIEISQGDVEEMTYTIKVRGIFPYMEKTHRSHGRRYISEGYLRSSGHDYTVEEIDKDEIIDHLIWEYTNHAH